MSRKWTYRLSACKSFKIKIKMVRIHILKGQLVRMCLFLLIHWHKLFVVCPYGAPFWPAEGLCVQKGDELSGLFEKQMSSLVDLMKLSYCLCLLLLYYKNKENSLCYPSLISVCPVCGAVRKTCQLTPSPL